MENTPNNENTQARSWTQHVEFLVLLVTMIGGVYAIDGKIERQDSKIEHQIAAQSQRTDKLYEMFVELVKATKK